MCNQGKWDIALCLLCRLRTQSSGLFYCCCSISSPITFPRFHSSLDTFHVSVDHELIRNVELFFPLFRCSLHLCTCISMYLLIFGSEFSQRVIICSLNVLNSYKKIKSSPKLTNAEILFAGESSGRRAWGCRFMMYLLSLFFSVAILVLFRAPFAMFRFQCRCHCISGLWRISSLQFYKWIAFVPRHGGRVLFPPEAERFSGPEKRRELPDR